MLTETRTRGVAQRVHRYEGAGAAGLADGEAGQQHRPGDQQGQGPRVAPRGGAPPGQPGHRGDQAGGDQTAPGMSIALRATCRPTGYAGQGQHRGEDRDGHVDPEHRVPAGVLDQEPPDQRSDRQAETRHPGPDADHQGQFAAGEDLGQQRQRQRGQEGRADALHRPCPDQFHGGGGQAAGGRPGGEQQQTGDEHAAPAQPVAELAAQQYETGERHDVGVDGPLQLVRCGAQVPLDRRHRDVDDGVVQEDGEQRQAGSAHRQHPDPARHDRTGGRGGGHDTPASGVVACTSQAAAGSRMPSADW